MIQQINNATSANKCAWVLQQMAKVRPYLMLVMPGWAVVFMLAACSNNNTGAAGPGQANIPRLVYTKHARCRMDCRHITEAEIKEILIENNINSRKSDPAGKPCPSYAYEGYSNEHQHLRIVIGKCDEKAWKVITCIDLGNEFECDCH